MKLDYEHLLHFFILSVLSSFLAIFLINDRHKKVKIALLSICSIFYILQTISMLTIMWDMNYHFITNLFEPTNYTVAFTTYREYSWLGVGVVLLLIVAIYFMNKKIKIKNNKIRLFLITACCIFLLTPYSLVHRFSKVLYQIMYNPSYTKSYQEVFKELTDQDFVDKDKLVVEGKSNKNIVIIFMESFEQNFLNKEHFTGINDNLRQLIEEGEFYSNIRQIEGSSWTMSGIHTTLCGSPEIYSVRKNKLFKTVTISNLVCLSDVLKLANYYQLYLGGEFKTFAGKSYFLGLHGYDKIYGDKEVFEEIQVKEEDKWGWGAKDREVFELAKQKYKELSAMRRPFNLTISTIAPHAPTGIYDSRCKNKNENSTLNAVQCDDELLADFISFLKQQDNYKDTIIMILPDHLLMASNASEMLNNIGNRKLYSLFLNTGINQEFSDKILYTDLAGMILDKLEIKHNAKFLLNNYKNKTIEERVNFINNNIEKIRVFNNKTIMQE